MTYTHTLPDGTIVEIILSPQVEQIMERHAAADAAAAAAPPAFAPGDAALLRKVASLWGIGASNAVILAEQAALRRIASVVEALDDCEDCE